MNVQKCQGQSIKFGNVAVIASNGAKKKAVDVAEQGARTLRGHYHNRKGFSIFVNDGLTSIRGFRANGDEDVVLRGKKAEDAGLLQRIIATHVRSESGR